MLDVWNSFEPRPFLDQSCPRGKKKTLVRGPGRDRCLTQAAKAFPEYCRTVEMHTVMLVCHIAIWYLGLINFSYSVWPVLMKETDSVVL